MSEDIYPEGWKHPQIVKWEQEDKEATADLQRECKEYEAERALLNDINHEIWYCRNYSQNQTGNGRVDEDQLDRLKAKWDQRFVALQSHPYAGSQARLGLAVAQRQAKRAEQVAALDAELTAFRQTDTDLLGWTDKASALKTAYYEVEADIDRLTDQLARIRDAWVAAGQEVDELSTEWEAKAKILGFPGKPTADLPRRILKQAHRYERSLLPGINATEDDVSRRRTFEEALV